MINYNAALPAENYPASRSGVNVTDWIQGVKGNLSYLIPQVFRGGEQGFFYDPSDLKAQYQDDAGTTVVNATGQPLGLVLDKSKGLVLGNELITNGDFSSGFSGWNNTNNYWQIVDGKAYHALGNVLNTLQRTITLTKHAWLEFDYEIIHGAPQLQYYGGPVNNIVNLRGKGKHRVFIPKGTSIILFKRGDNSEFYIDNVSLKEIIGNHAYQTASAARPIFRQKPIFGSELVVNGDFSNGTAGWTTNNATLNVVGGELEVTSTGSTPRAQQTITLVEGKRYLFTVKLRRGTTPNSNQVRMGTTLGVSDVLSFNSTSDTYREIEFIANASSAVLTIGYGETAVGQTSYWDNISIRELLGYRTDQNYIEYDGVDDKLITNLPAQLNNCTVLRAIPDVGTQVKYNQTLPMLYEDSTNHAGLVAINRALTRKEQLRLMEELDKRAGAVGYDTTVFKAFDNNQEGFVYDPNDLSTMYQDAAGTTPVTSAGQPVGLILDKRKGSTVGINLHTPTTPMNATTYPAIGTRSGLDITVSNEASGYAAVSLGMPTVVGKTYLLELIAPDVAGFWVLVSDSSFGDNTNRRTVISSAPASKINTKITFIFTASAAVTYIHLNRGTSVTSPATFKDVSVIEVLGNHAYQTTSASRPILRQNAVTGANYLEFDGTDDFLQTAVPLSFPVTAVAPFDFKSNSLTKCILSAGNSGYLRSTETTASVFSSSGGSTVAKKKVDVLLHELTGDSVNIRSNSAAIAMRDTDSKNPYGPLQKYIGSFSDTHTTLRAAMDLYGMVVVRKLLSASEEAELRAHFNKRMGI